MNKKLFLFLTVLLGSVCYTFAEGAAETIFSTLTPLTYGIGTGNWGASLDGLKVGLGALGGALTGGVAGAIVGGGGAIISNIVTNKEKKTNYQAAIENLNLTNKELESNKSVYETALSSWENEYEENIGYSVNQFENQIASLKENWGMTNASLASKERGGMTARLLSQQAKNQLTVVAGNDMNLNYNDLEVAVADAFSSGDMSKLASIKSSAYGLYEKNLIDSMITLRQNKKTTEQNLANTEAAIKQNKQSISDYTNKVDDLTWV